MWIKDLLFDVMWAIYVEDLKDINKGHLLDVHGLDQSSEFLKHSIDPSQDFKAP